MLSLLFFWIKNFLLDLCTVLWDIYIYISSQLDIAPNISLLTLNLKSRHVRVLIFCMYLGKIFSCVGLCDVIIHGNEFLSKKSHEDLCAVKLQDLKRAVQSINKFCDTMCLGFEWVRECISTYTLSLVKGKTWGREEQLPLLGGILPQVSYTMSNMQSTGRILIIVLSLL